MNKSNYALLTALYDSQSSDFYKDIYFPIIKYGIFLLYQKQVDLTKYYDPTNLQDIIFNTFGIKIPLIVIKQSIRTISNNHRDIQIELIHNGDQLSIRKIWDVSVTESIDRVYEHNLEQFEKLQKLFGYYIDANQVDSDESFIDFFSENTEDIYHYINNDPTSVVIVNEKFIHVVNFLKWLKENNIDLYNIASDIFWGSIIAAFLQRETDLNIKSETKISYYLDSSLIMSLLDLDSLANNLYCTELVTMIKTSGHLPYVHPLTIREIDSILYSVERDQTPKPNSGIAEAYDRRELSPSKILQIRQKLKQLIEDCGIYIDPCSDAQLDEIQIQYRSKASVKSLAVTRSNTINENIRDIHDVFMYDLMRSRNERCVSIEKCKSFFVTLNADLIDYYRKNKQDSFIQPIIHPARIVMDLWIHDSKTSNIRRNALTEVIARCTALNQTDVRRKLRLISKHYKENEFSEDNYRAVYLALMNRSKQVMSEIDAIQVNDNDKEADYQRIERIINTALEEERTRQSLNLEQQNKLSVLTIVAKQKDEQTTALEQENAEKNQLIQKQEALILYQEELGNLKIKFADLEKSRDKRISMLRYWVSIIIQSVCIISIFIFGCRYFIDGINSISTLSEFFDHYTGLIISGLVTLLSLIVSGLAKLSIFRPIKAYKSHRREITQEWEEDNPEYKKCKKDQEELLSKISSIKEDIANLKSINQ